MAKHFENKKYADSKFYQNKLANIMSKLNIEKYRYQYTENTAFINFKIDYKWYQIDHNLENAKKNNPGISTGSDLFAELVLGCNMASRMLLAMESNVFLLAS